MPLFRIGELLPEHMPLIYKGEEKKELPSPARKPVLCPGCPHRFVFSVLERNKAIVAGDIGCYTLAATPPLSTLHTCLCMGAAITLHEGFRRDMPDGEGGGRARRFNVRPFRHHRADKRGV